jgi:hypothetical protein
MFTTKNFDPQAFVAKVLEKNQLNLLPPETRAKFEKSIEKSLYERLSVTVFNSLDDHDIERYEQILAKHPEFEALDAVAMIAPNIPGLEQMLEKAMDELFRELIIEN